MGDLDHHERQVKHEGRQIGSDEEVHESIFRDHMSKQKTFGSLFHNKKSYKYMQRENNWEDEEDEYEFYQYYRPGQQTIKRCMAVLLVIAIIFIGSAFIGYAIEDTNEDEFGEVTPPVIAMGEEPSQKEVIEATSTSSSTQQKQHTQQDLFQMAQSVDEHCHAEQLKSAHGRWECQQICHNHLCCFDTQPGDEAYNCRNDDSMLCGVFAGCEVLIVNDFVESPYNFGGSSSASSGTSSSSSGTNTATKYPNETQITEQKKKIEKVCNDANFKQSSIEKQRECTNICEDHLCCFDSTVSGGNCENDIGMMCEAYESCWVHWEHI